MLNDLASVFGWNFGLGNSTVNLVIVHVIYGLGFTTLFFRNYYVGLPDELIEAARIDGASLAGVLSRNAAPDNSTSVVVPLAPRNVVANSRTDPRSRNCVSSTLRSTPGRPSHVSSDSPRACSSPGNCARSRNAGLAARTLPSASVTTKPSGAAATKST